jgi:STE24 endopeptidase
MMDKEKDLRSRVEKISNKVGFPITEILKCDGSKRSNHSNAYFFGIFKKKRIVIFDTLIEQCSNDETEAVVFHELGHWYYSHNVVMLCLTFVQFYVISWWVGLVLGPKKEQVFASFGYENGDSFIGFNLAIFTIAPVRFTSNFEKLTNFS